MAGLGRVTGAMMTEPTTSCPGSGGWPAEQVILDTVPGMNPRATCPVCLARVTLTPFRVPEHVAIGPDDHI